MPNNSMAFVTLPQFYHIVLGDNWEVLDSDTDGQQKQFFINICNDILTQGKASQCPSGSSVCYKGKYK